MNTEKEVQQDHEQRKLELADVGLFSMDRETTWQRASR